MEITQLRTLLHVAELGSLRRAADRLSVAQPALSRQVRQLEAELGAPLFVRHGRGMVPTDLCRRILRPVGGILSSLEDIREAADSGRRRLGGRVRVGMTPTIAEMATVELARTIRNAQPEIELSLSVAYSGHLLDWLKRDLIDCCISYDPEEDGAVRFDPVLSEALLLISRADGTGRSPASLPFRSLAGRPMVLPSPLHGLRRIIERCAGEARTTLRPAIEADTLRGMIELVSAGFGSTILPKGVLGVGGADKSFDLTTLTDPEPRRRVVVVYPRDRAVIPGARYVGAAFLELSRRLIAEGRWDAREAAR